MKSQLDNQQGYKLVEFGEDFDEVASGKSWKNDVIDECDNLPIITKCSMRLEDTMGPRFKNFLDSSIWFYAYSTDAELEEIKRQIIKNNKRYTLKKAREYREFYTRMLANAYLSGDHDAFVSPFLFHSEQELKKKIDEHKQIIDNIKHYKWRILLVDDHVGKTKMKLSSGEESTLTKLDIVKTELEKLFKNIEKDNKTIIIATEKDDDDTKKNATIYIECASSIEEAKSKLSRKKYEIILLDYLLGEKGGGREYGYELLRDIHDIECEIKKNPTKEREIKSEREFDYKKGPDNRFYFMFISAFTTAVSERLLTQGWLRSEDYWYIGEGACPINTPYLFQYRLLHIMEKRMKDMGLSKMLYVNRNDFEKSYIKTNIIDVIYAHSDKNVRQSANEHFNDILSLLYNYKNLLVDTHNASNPFDSPESTLATDIVMKNAYIGGFLEHLTQLVYLTAFGTVRQWPEMWEEYQFIQSVVGRIQTIESYIIKLKNNQIE